jgi:hypothetical protein
MKMKAFSAAALLVFCIITIAMTGPAHAGYPYVGLFGGVYDTTGVECPGGLDHSACSVYIPEPYTDIEMWIWWLPDPVNGLKGVQFKIQYPTSAYISQGVVTTNPLIVSETGSLPVGIVSEVSQQQCRHDWFWSHHQTVTLKKVTPSGFITIVADPGLSQPPYAILTNDCDYNSHATTVVAPLGLNQQCIWISSGDEALRPDAGAASSHRADTAPLLDTVTVSDFNVIHAHFGYTGNYECTMSPYELHFRMYDKMSPGDTMPIAEARKEAPDQYSITFQTSMQNHETYVLGAQNMCICEGYCSRTCASSSFEFTFDASVATLLQSSSAALRGSAIEVAWTLSAIDEGTSFFVSRSESGGDYKVLDVAGLSGNGLKYTYFDRAVEPGKSYTYKVEYGVGAPSRTLFISEAVSTPALPLTLYQNKPNPFNPTTAISFYLPQESIVGLEIYDISGRLVTRLVAGERRAAGTHHVEWNGRDARGAAVASGVYPYRLTAGKETISKKMVLLR